MNQTEPFPLLYAPDSFIEASLEMKKAVCNGCGPAGWKRRFVPDTIWGLDICPVCDIHDWMYFKGQSHEDKVTADRVFLYNMQRTVMFYTDSGLLLKLRLRRAQTYYKAVVDLGGPAFWAGKNDDRNEIWTTQAAVRGRE